MTVLSFINMKGGVAKTTLAVNIADCLRRRHDARVLVVDVDPQFNATQCLMAPDEYVKYVRAGGATIVDVFDRQARASVGVVDGTQIQPPRTLESIVPVRIAPNLDLLPGALELYRLEMAPGEGRENRLKKFLSGLTDKYEYVIVDTPPTPSVWMTSALIASDYYVVPVRPDPISLTGIDLLNNIVAEKKDNFSLSVRCAGLVLTVVEANTKVYETALAMLKKNKIWGPRLFGRSLIKRTQVAQQQLQQQFILDSNDSDLRLCLTQITQELLQRIGGRGE